ncbi:KPN_02809 family neutral zinc metallopeptidase [Coralloluteibacterium stylophorae]|uniref:Neutral zinc metallopeptidase n=1 Tax=Coralloluteibacterium stylophorae TaxID=1776034 RepID=A0A8J7VRY7_9GAMM|nr:neutral zinc metallopeptidase [Coralloluteibacterium stylophorae]MBS7455532.1 neutral zinc metallopeptidase [Coralloluteibacterium stylophorae]
MRWRTGRTSTHVQDRRGRGGGLRLGGGLGIGGIVVVLLIGMLMGGDPLQMLAMLGDGGGAPADTQAPAPGAPDRDLAFVNAIVADTESTWGALFARAGQTYAPPEMVLFSGSVSSGCGSATAAVGPFYCPADRTVYLDTGFFDEMRQRLGGGGDFAEAYVIAHEVGHHVQTLTGSTAEVDRQRAAGRDVAGASGPLVRQELQADCLAGVWAHHAQRSNHWLEPGDLERAMDTAAAIGDDRLQRQSRGTVTPDSFSHGTSEQRTRWFRAGFDSGALARCDTFASGAL